MITILIVGVIAAVTLPVVQKSQPDKLEAMRRKSYYILEQTVAQIYNDDSMYLTKNDGSKLGFRNTEKIKLNGNIYEGKTKFCELYANSLTKRHSTVTNCNVNSKTFTSSDNVDWYLPVTDFKNGYGEVKFDVNGKAEPNCEYNAKTCQKPDTFIYYVLSNGKIVEKNPNLSGVKYCITTNIKGKGSVSPSNVYCGLSNGTYTITANPIEGRLSNWQNNQKQVKINNKDETISVVFSESPKSCINLNVNCEAGMPEKCGNYNITNSSFSKNGNLLSACNLPTNKYIITVLPLSNYTSTWQTQEVNLSGGDVTLDVSLNSNKHCAELNVSCPGGGANICGTYEISGNGKTVSMDTGLDTAWTCVLSNGSYNLTIKPNKRYEANKENISFVISNNDWKGNAVFSSMPRCSAKGYFEVKGKRYSCPFTPERISTAECNAIKASHGIKYCGYEFNKVADDYWAGAVKACGGVNKLPSAQELALIATYLSLGNPSIGPYEEIYNSSGTGIDTELAYFLEIPGGYASFIFWSNEELVDNYYAGHYASVRRIGLSGSTKWERYTRNGVNPNALCKLN